MRPRRWCTSIPTADARRQLLGARHQRATCIAARACCGPRAVADDFHARFSARVAHLPLPAAERARGARGAAQRVGWYHRPLDVERDAAAPRALLVGEHDFSAFRDAQCQAKSPVRNLHRGARRAARQPRRLHLPRQRLPAPHGPQHRGLAGLRRRRQAAAGVDRGAHGRARPHATPRPPSRPTGCTSRASSTIRRSPCPPSAATLLLSRETETARASRSAASREPEHARVAADAGADAIGLVFYPRQPALRRRRMRAARRRRGAAAVRDRRGALRGRRRGRRSARSSRRCRLDLLQFHGDETPEFCDAVRRALRARGAHGGGDRFGRIRTSFLAGQSAAARCARARRAGRNRAQLRLGVIPRELPDPASSFPAASTAENVGRAIREVQPWAVDVSSGVEVEPRGRRIPRKIVEFIRSVQREDAGSSA